MQGDFTIFQASLIGSGADREWELRSIGGHINGFVVRFPARELGADMPPIGLRGHRCMVRENRFYIKFPDEPKAVQIASAVIVHSPALQTA